jgi:hypothetical protein
MCLSAHQQRDENRPQLTPIFRNSPFATRYFHRRHREHREKQKVVSLCSLCLLSALCVTAVLVLLVPMLCLRTRKRGKGA